MSKIIIVAVVVVALLCCTSCAFTKVGTHNKEGQYVESPAVVF